MTIWGVLLGIGIGTVLAVLWVRGSWARRVAGLETALDGEERRRRDLEVTSQSLDAEKSRLLQELAVARSELLTKDGEIATQQEFLEATKREIENTFKALASNALEGNTRRFLDLAEERLARTRSEAEGELEKRKQAIQSMIDPLKEALSKFESSTGEIEKARVNAYAQIDTQVRALAEQTLKLQEKTTSLDTALRGNQVRGRWGELALRNIVELAGMTEHCDFFEQQTVEGGGRPDMPVRLPGGRFIAIDAKAPLSAYLEAMETTSEKERAAALARHVSDLRGHIRQLAAREYAAGLEGSLDLVVLFLPGIPTCPPPMAATPTCKPMPSPLAFCSPPRPRWSPSFAPWVFTGGNDPWPRTRKKLPKAPVTCTSGWPGSGSISRRWGAGWPAPWMHTTGRWPRSSTGSFRWETGSRTCA